MPAVRRAREDVGIQRDESAEAVQERFLQFLQEPEQVGENLRTYKDYELQVVYLKQNDETTLYVDHSHISAHDPQLADAIDSEYLRLDPYLRRAVQEFVRSVEPEYAMMAGGDDGRTKDFYVSFYNIPHVSKIRELRSSRVGGLSSVTGTVTRSSEVRPELLVGCFICEDCGGEVQGVEQQYKYTTPKVCRNPQCNNTKSWQLNLEKSIFVDWQRLRVQENASEIPPGSMPRSLDVILRHELVEKAKAGDKIVFSGALIVIPDISQFSRMGEPTILSRSQGGGRGSEGPEGVKGLKDLGQRELTYKLAFLACSVQAAEQRFNQISIRDDRDPADIHHELTDEERAQILQMKNSPNLYNRMVRSICPSVFGHDEVKRGVLLMLFGGVHKKTPEGIKLRGDINVCIVGDPSTAKSQFLKYVCSFLPRTIYTSGKASSAAGLTATVVKDPETGEFCVEAGALMLADNGICCIDEFDKMDAMDQVAIHEAMEQQTISITKAGIQATLNARTSILAAANPIYGRYDKSKSLKHNITISAPIMSRFDLFFVVLDECDEASDYHIANHIVGRHRLEQVTQEVEFSKEMLQRYIKFARSFNPKITPEAAEVMVDCYQKLRQSDVLGMGGASKIAYRITVRQLESMIRLAEALARLHLDEEVRPQYVTEAFRLLKKSIIHVDTEDVELEGPGLEEEGDREEYQEGSEREEDRDEKMPDSADEGQDTQKRQSKSEQGSPSVKSEKSESRQGGQKKVKISYERYSSIANSLVLYLRNRESEAEKEEERERQDVFGLPQSELVAWYASEVEEDIETEEDLHREISLINQIIQRLISDGILCVLETGEDPAEEGPDIQSRIIYVHPNYAVQ